MSSSGNRVLDGLLKEDWDAINPLLEPVQLRFRQRLEGPGRRIESVYFPSDGLASVVACAGGRQQQSEVAIIGRDGFTGSSCILGADRSSNDVFVQVPGAGWRIEAPSLLKLISRRQPVFDRLLRAVHVLTVQVDQSALANARANVEQRLARWLLMAQDRLNSHEVRLTHEYLALMLGTRRASVTVSLHRLVADGALDCRRGTLRIESRPRLLKAAGPFYGEAERAFSQAFGSPLVSQL